MRQFFCEHCGKSVEEHDDVCSHCGAFFVALRCPRCEFQAKQHRFVHGCPNCGYLSNRFERFGSAIPRDHNARPRRRTPGWVFWLAVAGLVSSLGFLAIVYVRL